MIYGHRQPKESSVKESSTDMQKIYFEADSKANHFLLGAIVAACAYLAQSNPYAPLGLNPQTLFLVDLLVLSLAAFFAYRRIENAVQVVKFNAIFLQKRETGDQVASQSARELGGKYSYSTTIDRRVRNALIALGFFLYVGAKVWLAYSVAR